MNISKIALTAFVLVGLATSASATVLTSGQACSITGNIGFLQLNSSGGFSYRLKNIVATCGPNSTVITNPELNGCTSMSSSGACLVYSNVALTGWNITYNTTDVTTLNRQQAFIQSAATSGMKITISYTPSASSPTASEKLWLTLVPGFTFVQVP